MRASRWIFLTLALSLALGSASDAFSEVYRWKDSQGKVHFSDQPISKDPKVVKEVVVPSPNLANAFKPKPNAPASGMEVSVGTEAGGSPAAPIQPQTSQRPLGVTAKSNESCRLKMAAYQASKACFDACGKSIGTNGSGASITSAGRSGRNNAGCEHCVDHPMPQC